MKRMFAVIALLLIAVGSIFALDVEVGALSQGVTLPLGSADVRVGFGPFTGEVAAGFLTVGLGNPTISDGVDTEALFGDDFKVTGTALLAQAGVFFDVWTPTPALTAYAGARYGLGLITGGLSEYFENAPDDWYRITYTVGGSVSKFEALFGWDFSPQEAPNLIFSAGVGLEYWSFGDITLHGEYEEEYLGTPDSDEMDYILTPNLTGWKTSLEFGVRLALGGSSD